MRLGLLVGLLVILAGTSIVLHSIFNIDLPIFRTALGVFIIYLGVRFILGGWGWQRVTGRGDQTVVMTDAVFTPESLAEKAVKYSVVFGRGVVDLTRLPKLDRDADVQVDTVFGSSVVKVDPRIPVDIEANSAFGEARMPDRNVAAFGTTRYTSPNPEQAPRLHVKMNVVFGSSHIEQAAPTGP